MQIFWCSDCGATDPDKCCNRAAADSGWICVRCGVDGIDTRGLDAHVCKPRRYAGDRTGCARSGNEG